MKQIILTLLILGSFMFAQDPETVGKITDIIDVDISTTTYRVYNGNEHTTFHFSVIVTVNSVPLIIYGDSEKELNEVRIGRTVFLDIKEDRYIIRWHMLKRSKIKF